jgi:hypothetical protein
MSAWHRTGHKRSWVESMHASALREVGAVLATSGPPLLLLPRSLPGIPRLTRVCVCVCVCVCVSPCEGQFQRASCWAVLDSRGVLQVKGPDCITFLQGACQALPPEVAALPGTCAGADNCFGLGQGNTLRCGVFPPLCHVCFSRRSFAHPAPNQDSQPTTCGSSRKTRRVQLPAPSSTPKVRCGVSLNPRP